MLLKILEKRFKLYPTPVTVYLLKANNRNTRTKCGICSKLTIKTPEGRHWRRFGVFIVNFEHISCLVLVFLLLTLNMYMPTGVLSKETGTICNFQSMRTLVELNSLLLIFFCYITWFDETRHWRPCKTKPSRQILLLLRNNSLED